MNLDLRENHGLSAKLHRQIAVKLLENYTYICQHFQENYPKDKWFQEEKYFNPKLLKAVYIPKNLIASYDRKLQQMSEDCL